MEARTKATEWHDQLLHANAATMYKKSEGSSRQLLDVLDETSPNYGKAENWNEAAEGFGTILIRFGWGFDTTVQRLIHAAQEDGLNSDTLPNDIEREMLKGLQDSPEYQAYEFLKMS